MKKTISLVLVLALGLAAEVANADFTFGTPENLGPTVNSSSGEGSPSISADGLSIIFTSNRPGGRGSADLWITTRESTGDYWGEPVNLGLTVNSSAWDGELSISTDGLELYFASGRPGGSGGSDLWVTTRSTVSDPWREPVNLGSTVNSSAGDIDVCISSDGLSLYIESDRGGGHGNSDLWVAKRATTSEPWEEPVNLGSTINTSTYDGAPSVSADGRMLFFSDFPSPRPGGYGGSDIWVTTRAILSDPWGEPVNIGPTVNGLARDQGPNISSDGSTLYFFSTRSGGSGDFDIWQASILPVVDLNGDGIVNGADLSMIADYWGTAEPLCDIGPMPWGDGIVDVQDLIVLAKHLFEEFPPVELEEVNVDEEDYGSQVELEQGQILVVTLKSNPTTGYRWEVAENQESILEQMGEAEFKPSETGGPPLVGAGGWEIFRFKANSAGQMTLQLVYHRPWEEGVEPVKTFSIQVVVN